MQSFDVIVVGGGPAGAASALKCSQLGFNTLLVEKGPPDRHKPCGGVIPTICADILCDLGLKIPSGIMCSPPMVGLFYVPPSGRKNGGYVKNYSLLNMNRDRFDGWLRKAAESSGAQILYEAEFVNLERNGSINVYVFTRAEGCVIKLSTRYLIGADGTFSAVRKQLYPNAGREALTVLQECWLAEGDLGEYFYSFLKGDITPTYGYVIPKDRLLIVGTGALKGHRPAVVYISRFREWLRREFAFNPISLERSETAAIPYSPPTCGKENVILVGDAAGFCNPFTGEGIRHAIKSGIAAGEAVQQAEHSHEALASLYAPRVKSLTKFICTTREFAMSLTDDGRENFIRSELARISLTLEPRLCISE
jgi:flavin-dependent dehydrogenase